MLVLRRVYAFGKEKSGKREDNTVNIVFKSEVFLKLRPAKSELDDDYKKPRPVLCPSSKLYGCFAAQLVASDFRFPSGSFFLYYSQPARWHRIRLQWASGQLERHGHSRLCTLLCCRRVKCCGGPRLPMEIIRISGIRRQTQTRQLHMWEQIFSVLVLAFSLMENYYWRADTLAPIEACPTPICSIPPRVVGTACQT